MNEDSNIKVVEQQSKNGEMVSGIARINIFYQAPTPEALAMISEKQARKYHCIPISVANDVLQVAMAQPDNILTIETLAALTKKRIDAVPATDNEINEAIDFNYKAFGEIAKEFGLAKKAAPEDTPVEMTDDSPVAKTLNTMIEEAVKSRASDIHIQPEQDRLDVRYRIDGTLHEITSLPLSAHNSIISRIKILADMNIADHLHPQDGQISTTVKGRDIDIRVATINTVYGERAVLRILDKSMGAISLSQLGLLSESMKKFEHALMAPYGLVLVSGPTGAGKTTTLYAAINSLDKIGRNIITIEDPVEYRFAGISQIQVNARAGVTFPTGLRSILRHDPNVILVGEIRDAETAQISTQSALTGHLVLSSVHANDTAGVLSRLIDLGIEPFIICSSVICVVAQRMVRRVCPFCAESKSAPVAEQIAYRKIMGEERTDFLYGSGCRSCTYTGYLGRTGIFEIMIMSDEIKSMLNDGSSSHDIRNVAIKEGMITLAADGMLKAGKGITTPHEVLLNVYNK